MKSRLFVLLTALFMVGNVFAGTPLEDDLVLMGEFFSSWYSFCKTRTPDFCNFRRKCPVC